MLHKCTCRCISFHSICRVCMRRIYSVKVGEVKTDCVIAQIDAKCLSNTPVNTRHARRKLNFGPWRSRRLCLFRVGCNVDQASKKNETTSVILT